MVKTLDLKKKEVILIKTDKTDHFKKPLSLGSMDEAERLNI